MQLIKISAIILFCFLGLELKVYSQEADQKDSLYQEQLKKPRLEIGLSFMSDEIYNGFRVDGEPQWGLHPSLNWYTGNGWYLQYTGNYWSRNNPRYALTTIGINKDWDLGDFSASAGYSYWFYHLSQEKFKAPYHHDLELDGSWEKGDFGLECFSMLLWGAGFSFYFSPSLHWQHAWWLGQKTRYGLELIAGGSWGRDDATRAPIFNRKMAGIYLPGDSTNTTRWLVTEPQLVQELVFGHHVLSAALTMAVPARANLQKATLIPYFSLGYTYRLWWNKKS